MKQYLDLMQRVMTEGTDRIDRTKVGTRSLFGAQMRFNLQEGFPAVTTKRLAWKAMVSELLWFIEGSGDEKRLKEILHGDRESEKPTIWTENAEADYWFPKAEFDGDLGRVYGNMWRKWPASGDEIKMIKKRPKEQDAEITYEPVLLSPIVTDDLTGFTSKTQSGLAFTVIERLNVRGGNAYYKVQFHNTGNVVEVSRPNIKSGTFGDFMEKTQSGVGVFGRSYQGVKKTKLDRKIYTLWVNMISRCYDPNHPAYKFYGANGVTVSTEWQNFSKFEHSIKVVPGFYDWASKPGYDLDKDYYCANHYSESTCIFIHNKFNKELRSNKFKETDTHIERRIFFVDQLAQLIEGIKKDPMGRRHILTAWNPGELDRMALPPCHAFSQFYVAEGKLSCQMYQRSADLFLGVPFNIASYSLFTHMIAQVCDLKVGEFVHTFGDVHIYHNHFKQVEEQLSRTPHTLPTLRMNKDVKHIGSFVMEDFELENYKPQNAIKAPMAV